MKNLRFFVMFFGLVAILSMLFTSVPLPMISIAQEPGESCGINRVYDCSLNCVWEPQAAWWTDDGWCDRGGYGINLVCAAFNFDGGDCSEPSNRCAPGKRLDCDLNCVSETTINAACSNFYCDQFLNCPAFNDDCGVCGPAIPNTGCGDGYTVYDCNLNCSDEGIMVMNLHNGVCDEYLNCAEFGFDYGACTPGGQWWWL